MNATFRIRKKTRVRDEYHIDVISFVLLAVFCIVVIFPFWKMLVDSFSTDAFFRQMGLKLFPRPISFKAYKEVFSSDSIYTAFYNTIIRTVSGTALTLVVGFMAAFAISKTELPGIKLITALMIVTMFFSGGIIPLYLWFRQLGLINTMFSLIITQAASAYYIIIMRNFIMALPPDLEESALLDGAGYMTILFRIVLPLSRPVVATIALWVAVYHWNEWMHALIFTPRRQDLTLALYLRRLLIENQATALLDMDQETEGHFVEETIKASSMFVTITPILLVYPFLQRYFVKGIMTGAVKG